MSDPIIVIGGGGHAKVVIDCIEAAGNTVMGVLDDSLPVGSTVLSVPVLGKIADYTDFRDNPFIIAIGSNAVRRKFAESLPVRWHTAVHPRAVVSPYARIGEGCAVMPGAVINAGAEVGAHSILNTCSVVEHDGLLGRYVHVSPSAALGGTVTIGDGTHVGIGATVKNNISICGGCIIGAGAVVVKNITECGTYVGIPAHLKK